MINLLPYAKKSEIRAARTNTILARYIAIMSIAALVLGGLIGAAYAVLDTSRASAQEAMDASTARTSQFESIRTEADSLQSELTSAKSILDQKISYTKLIYEIADALPAGVILDALDLDPSTFGSEMTIAASAKDFQSASQLEEKFSSKSEVFSSVKLLSIQSSDDSTEELLTDYPVQVNISVVINKEALR